MTILLSACSQQPEKQQSQSQQPVKTIDLDVALGDKWLNGDAVNHYNAENQLIQTLTRNYKVSFTYDAEGLHTSKTVNGKTTVYVWDGDQIVLELSGSGKVQKRYIRGNDLVYADQRQGTEKQYYVTNPHGDVVQLTDEDGTIIKTYEYDSFGNEVNPKRKDENPFRYCGEYYDKETEEVYLRARYYEPAVGRFLTRDAYTGDDSDPESLHLYVYCYNNPILYSDMTGNSTAAPQPGSAPPDPPKHAYDFVSPSVDEQIAETYLRSTRFKGASVLEAVLALSHYEANQKQEKELMKQQYKGKYITDQSKLKNMKFGTTNMSYAGCELIAIYNAILLKGKKRVPLSDIIRKCELSGYTALTGQWGTNPYRIGKLITKCGVNYSVIKGPRKLKMKKRNVYIISFWNSTNITGGIHTIAVKVKGKNKMESFNEKYLDTPKTLNGKFKNLLENRPFIIGYQLK